MSEPHWSAPLSAAEWFMVALAVLALFAVGLVAVAR